MEFKIETCPSRTGTSASHCDHQTNLPRYCTQPKYFKCCYCGRERIQQPIAITGGVSISSQGHGPFYTPPITYNDSF